MILGLRTAVYPVADIAAGKAWYVKVLGFEPYFEESVYVGFSVGGFELGLIPDGKPGQGGATPYWGVPDVAAELTRLVELGATVIEEAHDVGGGITVGSVADPWGNTLGVIHNPYFNIESVK